jgi:hypothetical protein
MSYQITNLKKLLYSLISGGDRIVVTEVTNSLGKIETKAIELSEFTKYYYTSSNISNIFRTGSYDGIFYGIFSGSVDSSSFSITSSKSLFSNHLNYSATNGTASYSVNSFSSSKSKYSSFSLSSSFTDISLFSNTSSYVFVNQNVNFTKTSYKSNSSISSSISQKTKYIIPSNNNGIVRRSIHSDKSVKSDFADKISSVNTTKMKYAYESEKSYNAITASVSDYSSYAHISNKSKKVLSGNTDAFAYCSFQVGNNNKLIPLCWYNVSKITFVTTPVNFSGCQFIISYFTPPNRNQSLIVKADSSPLSGGASNADIKNNTACWAVNCSRTSGIIYVHRVQYGKTRWSGAWTQSRYLRATTPRPILSNSIFSFAAFTIQSNSSGQPNSSGSNDEAPPTTNSSNCY